MIFKLEECKLILSFDEINSQKQNHEKQNF